MTDKFKRNGWAIALILSMTVVGGISPAAQPATGEEDVLFLIPASQRNAIQRTPTLHVCHRLPGYYVAVASRRTYERLIHSGTHAELLDEHPAAGNYAVVSTHPGASVSGAIPGVRVLSSIDDMYIVRGTEDNFAALRERGFSCVEIGHESIPVSSSATHAPRVAANFPDDSIIRILSGVADSNVTSTIQGLQDFGTRYAYNANRDSVFSWVRQRFLDAGVSDVVLDSFQYGGTWQKNVVATIPGTLNPSAEIIVGGHLDSYSSNLLQAPGADDNATGTAAAIEMARALVNAGYQPHMTIRFIGFAAEELGLRGSASYASRARLQNRDIKAMLNYDMVGYRDQSQSSREFYMVWYPGSEEFSNLHALMATSYTTLTPVFTTSYRSSSDSWSFYQQSYNTLFCIERNFSPYYHSPNDLLQYLDIPFARDIIRSGLATVLTLDGLPPSVFNFRITDCGNGTSLLAEWDSVYVSDLYRYKVHVGTQPGVYTTSFLQTNTSATINGLTTGIDYYVGVSTIDLAGNESPIIEQSEIPLAVPRPPSGITAEGVDNGIVVTWEPNSEMDLKGYNVFRLRYPDTSFVLLTGEPIRDCAWTDTLFTTGTCSYYVTAVDSTDLASAPSDTVSASPIVGIAKNAGVSSPVAIALYANYPNPFNPSTVIRYSLPENGYVSLTVFDAVGRKIATLVDGMKAAGTHSIQWDARKQASGIYYATLQVGEHARTIRMVLVR